LLLCFVNEERLLLVAELGESLKRKKTARFGRRL
jgi:hypothetical protein